MSITEKHNRFLKKHNLSRPSTDPIALSIVTHISTARAAKQARPKAALACITEPPHLLSLE